MARLAYLTPDNLSGDLECFPLYIPSHLFHYVVGALGELTLPHNWESFGTVTPAAAAEFFDERLLALVTEPCPEVGEVFSRTGSRNSDQTIPNNANTGILWSSSNGDFDYFTINLTTGVISILQPGRYLCSFGASFVANGTGVRRLRAVWSGGVSALQLPAVSGATTSISHTFSFRIASGTDELTLQVFQNSGASLDLDLDTGIFGPAHFAIVKIG